MLLFQFLQLGVLLGFLSARRMASSSGLLGVLLGGFVILAGQRFFDC